MPRAESWRSESQPFKHASLDIGQLLWPECSDQVHELRQRDRDDALSVERARFQKRNRNNCFELRPAKAGGMWHDRDQRAVLVAGWNANDQGRSNLRRKPQVDKPDLSATRLFQFSLSLRSYSTKTRSAADVRSSSWSGS